MTVGEIINLVLCGCLVLMLVVVAVLLVCAAVYGFIQQIKEDRRINRL